MNTLFDLSPVLPEGFTYIPDFIDENEEINLMQILQQFPLETMKFHEYEAKRKVRSFGEGWSFTDQKLKKGEPVPAEFTFLLNKVEQSLHIPKGTVAQFLITEYPIASVINWHRDAAPFDIIIGLSLMTDCNFKLRPVEKERQIRGSTITLPVQRRSLYIMQGDARSKWQHSTAPCAAVRYSLTFRTITSKNVI